MVSASDASHATAFKTGHLCPSLPMTKSADPLHQVLSVPWTSLSRLSGGTMVVTFTLPPCGIWRGTSSGGGHDVYSVAIWVTAPYTADQRACGPATVTTQMLTGLAVPDGAILLHAPTGLLPDS